MHKRDALKLKEGDLITFGNSMWSAEVDREDGWREGTVLYVTPKGGIRVRVTSGREDWVPYHFVGSVLKRRRR